MAFDSKEFHEMLREVSRHEFFKAELHLEATLEKEYEKELKRLDLDENLPLKYAELRGALKALQKLKNQRLEVIQRSEAALQSSRSSS
jgi:hypothetical protein